MDSGDRCGGVVTKKEPSIITTWLIMYCNIVVVNGVLYFTYMLLHNNFP